MQRKTPIVCAGLCAVIGLIVTAARAGAADGMSGREYHVSVQGDDTRDGSAAQPLRTISAAARLAQSGDTITVHEGVYRERVNPPRGGASEQQRITYQAAPGEKVVIKGSDVVKGWEKAQNETWTVSIPNSFFGDFNPYSDLIRGDWFDPRGRNHHTGAVYLNGRWLTEAAKLDDVLKPVGEASGYGPGGGQYLWLGCGLVRMRRTPSGFRRQVSPRSTAFKRLPVRKEASASVGSNTATGSTTTVSTSARARNNSRFAPHRKRTAGSSRFGWTPRTENSWAPASSRTRAGGNHGLRSVPKSSR
jgi:hypothetical protein